MINKSLGKVLRLISSASVNGKPRERGRKGGGGQGMPWVSSTSLIHISESESVYCVCLSVCLSVNSS